MYTKVLKLKFNPNVLHSDRFRIMSELFAALEKDIKPNTGGIFNYKMKYSGSVTISISIPTFSKIINDYVLEKQKEDIFI